jgi:hypothetical protein
VQLRQLKLGGQHTRCFWDSDFAELDSLLAELPALTYLAMPPASGMPRCPPRGFLSNGFGGLRKLTLSFPQLPEPALQLATVLSELEALELAGDCRSLLPHLPPMPRLTDLEVQHYPNSYVPRPCVSGNVLARFSNLQRLCVHFVLDGKQWDEDVRSLTVLTDLRALRIHTSSCFRQVTNAQLMPLTVLKQLRYLKFSNVVDPEADVTTFRQAMEDVRHEMGCSFSPTPFHEDCPWVGLELKL